MNCRVLLAVGWLMVGCGGRPVPPNVRPLPPDTEDKQSLFICDLPPGPARPISEITQMACYPQTATGEPDATLLFDHAAQRAALEDRRELFASCNAPACDFRRCNHNYVDPIRCSRLGYVVGTVGDVDGETGNGHDGDFNFHVCPEMQAVHDGVTARGERRELRSSDGSRTGRRFQTPDRT